MVRVKELLPNLSAAMRSVGMSGGRPKTMSGIVKKVKGEWYERS